MKSVERIGGEDHVFKVRTDGPTMILKDLGVSPPDHRRLEIVQGVLDHVTSRAVQVAIPVRSRSGRIVAQSEGRHFLVLEYIEAGESPDDPGLSGELYHQAGLAIAELHDALASYPDDGVRDEIRREDMARGVAAWLSLLRDGLPEHQSRVVSRVEQERGAKMVDALSGLPEQLIHRDCHPGNVLVDGVRVVAFIDCDHICIASPVLDLATFAAQRVKRRTSEEDRHAWLRDLPRLLDGYRTRRGLSAPEVSALPYMMMAFHIMLSHWFMSTSQMDCIQLDIDALSWIHEHFEGIEDSIASSHPPHRQSRRER